MMHEAPPFAPFEVVEAELLFELLLRLLTDPAASNRRDQDFQRGPRGMKAFGLTPPLDVTILVTSCTWSVESACASFP
jgi:hypothetical protein